MEVYVLAQVNVDTKNNEVESLILCVSSDSGKPREVLEERQKSLRKYFEENTGAYEESEYSEDDVSWEIWEKDHYASNHVLLRISQETVE